MKSSVALYHEIERDNLSSVKDEGIKRTSRGEKGDDSQKAKTDKLLDSCRPDELKEAGISRDNNLYCYLTTEAGVVDITDGQVKPVASISPNQEQCLLKVEVDPARCYVSDLDLYDQIVETTKNSYKYAKELAYEYWQRLIRLDEYDHSNGFRRPEVMVTYDIPPSAIKLSN